MITEINSWESLYVNWKSLCKKNGAGWLLNPISVMEIDATVMNHKDHNKIYGRIVDWFDKEGLEKDIALIEEFGSRAPYYMAQKRKGTIHTAEYLVKNQNEPEMVCLILLKAFFHDYFSVRGQGWHSETPEKRNGLSTIEKIVDLKYQSIMDEKPFGWHHRETEALPTRSWYDRYRSQNKKPSNPRTLRGTLDFLVKEAMEIQYKQIVLIKGFGDGNDYCY